MNSAMLHEKAFHRLPLGLVLLDAAYQVVLWNDWLFEKTNIAEIYAIGKTLSELFPTMNTARFHSALEQLFNFKTPQIISQILNQYLIPISLEKNINMNLEYMQQHVEIFPVEEEGQLFALVMIQDVTHAVYQRNVLIQMGKKFEDQTYHDPLTGVYNRRFLQHYLEKLISFSKRHDAAIAYVMLDLDHFKKINDEYGHEKGDEVIVFFIKIIHQVIRLSDVVVRYGGEEFLLILPNTLSEMAVTVSKRILFYLETRSQQAVNQLVTCSAGVAIWQAGKDDLSPLELIDRADKALYKAKNNGRNRVEF